MTDRSEKQIVRRAHIERVFRGSTKGCEHVTLSMQVARVIIIESGCKALPAARRAAAFRGNDSGWAAQLQRIERHVADTL